MLNIGSRIITAETYNGLKMIDLFNHTMFGSLENWIEYLEMTDKYGISKAELTDYYERVMNDVKATYRLGEFINEFYEKECGIPLQLTIGSAAMRLFRNKFFTDYWTRENEFMAEYERDAYYGGRCEVFKRGEQRTFSYDVNSMYISVMRDELIPDPSTGVYCDNGFNGCIDKYLYKYLGVWHVKVKTPDNIYIPVLPVRLDGKLKFPKGTFSGKWTSVELIYALEKGYKILEVYNFIYYKFSAYYFSDYAKFIWDRRIEYKAVKNKGMDLMIKRLGNALYGKFAQRNKKEYFGRYSDYTGELIDGEIQFFEYFNETWIIVKGEVTPAKHEFPIVSAFITAYSRIKLLKGMYANESSLIYVDTDSLKLTEAAKNIEIGKDLGQWELEIEDKIIEYYRPKCYGDKRKGVPKRGDMVYRENNKEKWHYQKPLRYRESIKKGQKPNIWVDIEKILILEDDKRVWHGQNSEPIELNIN